jgi:hypothetical protein
MLSSLVSVKPVFRQSVSNFASSFANTLFQSSSSFKHLPSPQSRSFSRHRTQMSAEAESKQQAYAPGVTKIGWVGVGVMGKSMAGHLLKAGYQVSVFTRTAAKAQDLLSQGAVLCDSPAAVAARSDVVFSMVGFPSDVREVILGADGVLAGLRAGGVVVDMTTSEPSLAQEIDRVAREKGVVSVDAPVRFVNPDFE